MNLNPFSKVRTTAEIVATFDKTLIELQDRIDLDDSEVRAIEKLKEDAIERHRQELLEHDANTAAATASSERAKRIHAKISDLIG